MKLCIKSETKARNWHQTESQTTERKARKAADTENGVRQSSVGVRANVCIHLRVVIIFELRWYCLYTVPCYSSSRHARCCARNRVHAAAADFRISVLAVALSTPDCVRVYIWRYSRRPLRHLRVWLSRGHRGGARCPRASPHEAGICAGPCSHHRHLLIAANDPISVACFSVSVPIQPPFHC